MKSLLLLALDRIDELGDDAFKLHQDCLRWKPEPDEVELTKTSVRCQSTLEKQHEWVVAIKEAMESNLAY